MTRNRHAAAPSHGMMRLMRKCSCLTSSRRRTSTATLTKANTPSNSNAVVPPSARMASESARATRMIRPKASAVVNRMAVHGVWFLRCTCARNDGSTPWRDMP
ncbi:hypothetical protein D3C87_1740480 [compost metagenome]